MSDRPTDRIYARGGAAAVSGDYPRRAGVSSRLLRALIAHRGKWPGGRGEIVGSRLYETRVANPEGLAAVRSAIDEAWAEFVSAGEISDVQIEITAPQAGAVQFVASYTDLTTGERTDLPIPLAPEAS